MRSRRADNQLSDHSPVQRLLDLDDLKNGSTSVTLGLAGVEVADVERRVAVQGHGVRATYRVPWPTVDVNLGVDHIARGHPFQMARQPLVLAWTRSPPVQSRQFWLEDMLDLALRLGERQGLPRNRTAV